MHIRLKIRSPFKLWKNWLKLQQPQENRFYIYGGMVLIWWWNLLKAHESIMQCNTMLMIYMVLIWCWNLLKAHESIIARQYNADDSDIKDNDDMMIIWWWYEKVIFRHGNNPQKSQVPIGTFLGITRVKNFYHFIW